MPNSVNTDEKLEVVDTSSIFKDEKEELKRSDSNSQVIVDDFSKLPQQFQDEFHFTWRASIIGSLLGCLVGNFFFFFSASHTPKTKTRHPPPL
jgi:hypothetical protein